MSSVTVNDIHSELNQTSVDEVVEVDSLESIQETVGRARADHKPLAVAGGRHAMGGQQFCADGWLIDTRSLDRVLAFDEKRGIIEVEAGIQWPALLDHLAPTRWAIAQKQTGADRLSIGGAISANVHGRGLAMRPLVDDLESLVLVDAMGQALTCSRDENADLFRLVVGGYGLLGCIFSARLRLAPRRLLERVVEMPLLDELIPLFDERIRDGFLYGDFQFAIDPVSDEFMRRGVFSCYRPVEHADEAPSGQRALSTDEWQELIYLAHTDKTRAWDLYSTHYLATTGQLYYSDAHQLADYTDGYHRALGARLGSSDPATEMITEIYVPRERLVDFMAAVAKDFRAFDVSLIYGTIRLVEPDDESFLAWASERWACIIFNLCTVHTPGGLERSAQAFRRLIDRGLERSGAFYLTYHRWATREQIEACYPQFPEFLRLKRRYDPEERFQSEWYRHHRAMFADQLEPTEVAPSSS